MKYRILISYQTGDSFKTEDKEEFLDGEWENMEILKENLYRIKEHYLWYEDNYKSYGFKKIEEPEWHKGKPDNSILLKTDSGVEYWNSTFWCGYFERLYGAKVVVSQNDTIEFWL